MKLCSGFVNNRDVVVMLIIVTYIYYIYIIYVLNANVMYDVSTLHYSVNQGLTYFELQSNVSNSSTKNNNISILLFVCVSLTIIGFNISIK